MTVSGSILVRPVKKEDIDALCEIAQTVGPGFTSLPNNRRILENKLIRSVESFAETLEKGARLYMLAMEDRQAKKIIGVSGIEVEIGFQKPFYNYKISTITQVCDALDKYLEHKIIRLVTDHQHASELCSLFMHPDHRGKGRGECMSRARYLLIAEHFDWFAERMTAEMRGVSDENGNSPFWEAIGRHFFAMDFQEADYLTTVEGKQFISDLMPTAPIYIDLLSKEAKDVIGKPHDDTRPAVSLLEKEGFCYNEYIDIFDGGPLLEVPTKQIETVKQSKLAKVATIEDNQPAGKLSMVCCHPGEFRLSIGKVTPLNESEISIDSALADCLDLKKADSVRYCALRYQET